MRQFAESSSSHDSMTPRYPSSVLALPLFTGIRGDGSEIASFAYTVLRETPVLRAISDMDSPFFLICRIE